MQALATIYALCLPPDPWPLIPALSTLVERALQIQLFMQNKAKFRKSQMNLTDVIIMDYEQMDTWSRGKKQSQTKPKSKWVK